MCFYLLLFYVDVKKKLRKMIGTYRRAFLKKLQTRVEVNADFTNMTVHFINRRSYIVHTLISQNLLHYITKKHLN